jgi:polyphosphate:AMP phosphotransferase
MFDSANLDHHISKSVFKREEKKLREALLQVQSELVKAKSFSVLLLVGGIEGAGKGETVNLLNEWMDPRHIQTFAFGDPTPEELRHPPNWRYWQALPANGKMGIFFGGWHSQPILDRAFKKIGKAEFDAQIADTHRFERMLADEGVLLLKFWFHLTKRQQQTRLVELGSNKRTRWRVQKFDWKLLEHYDRLAKVSEHFVRATSTGDVPWVVVPGADPEYRSLLVGKTILASVRDRLTLPAHGHAPQTAAPRPAVVDRLNVVGALKLDQPLGKAQYQDELERWQGRLALATRHRRFQRDVSVVCVFEGNDAAGKGGAIRRVTQALDARMYRPISIAAPTEEERAQPYLWRFWRHVPRRGRLTIFDRSWYGRVLVERVEGFCTEYDWMRGYSEINDFENQLVAHGAVVVKFWLAISKAEQLKRFKARQETSFKQWKITPEDWRNRKKWDAYERAVCDMVDRTSTEIAPWTLVEANNKYHARLKVLRTLVRALEERLSRL